MCNNEQPKRDVAVHSTSHDGAVGCNAKARPLSAATAAFLEYNTFLKKFLAGFLPAQQDIEDVAQEAYLRAYIAEQRECIQHPKAFLFRIAKNLALTELTKKSRQITDYIEEASAAVVMETAAAIDQEIEAEECLGLYCEAVASLPDKCRQVFLLRKVHGLAHKDIAQRMELSISSVEKYLCQGILACEVHIRHHESPSMPIETQALRSRGKVRS